MLCVYPSHNLRLSTVLTESRLVARSHRRLLGVHRLFNTIFSKLKSRNSVASKSRISGRFCWSQGRLTDDPIFTVSKSTFLQKKFHYIVTICRCHRQKFQKLHEILVSYSDKRLRKYFLSIILILMVTLSWPL